MAQEEKCPEIKNIILLDIECPTNYEKVTVDGKDRCYLYGTDAKTWADAATYCSGESGGYLAVITSEAEQTALKTWLNSKSKFMQKTFLHLQNVHSVN